MRCIECDAAAEASVTPGRPFTSFRHVRRVTLYAPHCTVLRPGRVIARRAFTRPANPGAKGDRTREATNFRWVPIRESWYYRSAAGQRLSRDAYDRSNHVRSPAKVRNSSTARAWPSGNNADAMRLKAVPGPSSKADSAPADRQLSRHAAQSIVVEI